MGVLLSVYSLSAITQTNKQTNNYFIMIYKLQVAYNTILQYLQYSDHNDNNNIKYKNYFHRGPCTLCGKMTHKENLDQSQNHF